MRYVDRKMKKKDNQLMPATSLIKPATVQQL
jgi:hypothetical protein